MRAEGDWMQGGIFLMYSVWDWFEMSSMRLKSNMLVLKIKKLKRGFFFLLLWLKRFAPWFYNSALRSQNVSSLLAFQTQRSKFHSWVSSVHWNYCSLKSPCLKICVKKCHTEPDLTHTGVVKVSVFPCSQCQLGGVCIKRNRIDNQRLSSHEDFKTPGSFYGFLKLREVQLSRKISVTSF